MERKRVLSWLKRNWLTLILCGGCASAGFLLGLLIFGKPWHLPPAWGDIPTWITGIATAGLLVGAIITAVYAVKTFRGQAEQIAILRKENDRQADERRRAQAAAVYIGIPPRSIRLVQPAAYNASKVPVYDAQFWYSGPGGVDGPDNLGVIAPGPTGLNGRQIPYEEAVEHAILTFRDAEGARWVRMPGGALEPQTRPTARESVLAALGQPVPAAAESAPAEAADAAEQPGGPEAPGAQ